MLDAVESSVQSGSYFSSREHESNADPACFGTQSRHILVRRCVKRKSIPVTQKNWRTWVGWWWPNTISQRYEI